MSDIGKILKALEICDDESFCSGCPYYEEGSDCKCFTDARELITAQRDKIALLTAAIGDHGTVVGELVRCRDCKHYYKGHCQADDTIYWCREPDWFCADGERQEGR